MARYDWSFTAPTPAEQRAAKAFAQECLGRLRLPALYAIHDALEAALREMDRLPVNRAKVRRLTWKAHDRLERVIVKAQATRKKFQAKVLEVDRYPLTDHQRRAIHMLIVVQVYLFERPSVDLAALTVPQMVDLVRKGLPKLS